jgi:CheY-like chemotaxis protein
MGGRVRLESEPGFGTRAFFDVRCEPAPELKAVGAQPAQISKVLVIGGSPLTRETLASLFERLPVEAQWLDDRTPDFTPEIVLVDVPEGPAPLQKWRKTPGWRPEWDNLPCVLIVTPQQAIDPEQLQRYGIADLVFRPVRLSRLESVLVHARTLSPVVPFGSPVLNPVTKPAVLIVEDNPVNQRVASRLLEKLGCAVETADSGLEALNALRRKQYALVFMDCAMPGMDGFETTQRIRHDLGSGPVVIALTAYAFEDDQKRCLAAGMNDYLTKPVTVENVRAVMQRWLPKDVTTAAG